MNAAEELREMIAIIKVHAPNGSIVRAGIELEEHHDRSQSRYEASVSADWYCDNGYQALIAHAFFKDTATEALSEVVAELQSPMCRCVSCTKSRETGEPVTPEGDFGKEVVF